MKQDAANLLLLESHYCRISSPILAMGASQRAAAATLEKPIFQDYILWGFHA